jgi:hypothetical protein
LVRITNHSQRFGLGFHSSGLPLVTLGPLGRAVCAFGPSGGKHLPLRFPHPSVRFPRMPVAPEKLPLPQGLRSLRSKRSVPAGITSQSYHYGGNGAGLILFLRFGGQAQSASGYCPIAGVAPGYSHHQRAHSCRRVFLHVCACYPPRPPPPLPRGGLSHRVRTSGGGSS